MKRIIVLLTLCVLFPLAVFAQGATIGLGGAMFFKSPVLMGQSIDADNLNVDQFAFGGDIRARMNWFQVEGLVFLSTGEVNGLNLMLDAGVALDIALVTLSVGAGPNLTYNFNESKPFKTGLNAKVSADLNLEIVSFGLSYIMNLDIDNGIQLQTSSGLLGAQILFWL